MSTTRDLRPLGPLGMMGRAFLVARRHPREVAARTVLGALPLLVAVLGLYWLEEVERARSLRPLAAAVLVAAWGLRAVAQARAARSAAAALWDAIELAPDDDLPLRALRTGTWTGVGLLPYLVLLLGALRLAPAAVFLALPVLALRGLVAPSALARAGCFHDAGAGATWRAFRDHRGRRGTGLVQELLLFLAFTVAAVNLYAFALVGLVLGRSLVGVDLTIAESFLSPRNGFTLLLFGGAALLALEPIRAALAAVMLVDAQVRQRGLDLRLRVEEAAGGTRPGAEPASAATVSRAAVALLAVVAASAWLVASAGAARAQGDDSRTTPPQGVSLTPLPPATAAPPSRVAGSAAPRVAPTQEDRRVRAETRVVLARPEFRDDPDAGNQDARDLLDRILEWVEGALRPEWLESLRGRSGMPSLPGGPIYLFAAVALLAVVLAYLILSYARRQTGEPTPAGAGEAAAVSADPRERPPEAHLGDAARLAAEGRFREALRALYLATLVSLDRRRLIRFDTTRTNWQYLRDLAGGHARADFAGFTRIFDHKWYGDEPATRDDYDRCRALAERLCTDDAEPDGEARP